LKGVVFKLPERHPKIGLPAIRAFYHIDRIDPPTAARLAKHIITGYFRDNLDTDDPYAIAQVASSLLGMDRDSVLAGINDPEVKAITRQHAKLPLPVACLVRPGFLSMAISFGAAIASPWDARAVQ
jgi:2-hydroxychromene-2-carboxylate isomerase